MINSVELHNWKTHKNTVLNFSRGTNILIGQMGAGKSTVMDAISFALFGTYPAIQHRRVAVSGIIMNRPEQKREAYVKLAFSMDGDAYTVKRMLELNGSAKATLEKNDSYLQSQPERVNEGIEDVLKIDYDLFSRAVYSEQNRLTYFLELTPKERKRQIDELLGLDKFAVAQENVTALVNKIKDAIESSESVVKSLDIKKMKEQLELMNCEMEKIKKERLEIGAGLNKINREKESQEKALNEAKIQFNRKIAITKEIAELKSRMSVLKSEIEKINAHVTGDRESVLAAISSATEALKMLKSEEERARVGEKKTLEALATAEADARNLMKDSSEREKLEKSLGGKSSKDAKRAVEKAQEEFHALQVGNAAAMASKKENEKWLAELEKHISKCPVCEREMPEEIRKTLLKDKSSLVKELEVKIADIEKKTERLETEIQKGNKDVNDFIRMEDRIAELKDVKEKLDCATEKVAKAREESEKTTKAEEEKSGEVAKVNEKMARLASEKEAMERKDGYAADLEHTRKALKEKEGEFEGMDVDEGKIEKLQKGFTDMSSRAGELGARLSSAERFEKEKVVQVKDKEKEIERIDALYEDIKKKEKAVGGLQKYKNALADTQVVLRTKLVEYINQAMRGIWPELYPYGDYPAITLEPAAEDYVLKVKTDREGGKWEEVEAIASGGERSIACLAMRVAFALVLVPNLKWLILDEPTHNIDSRGLESFVRVISEVLPQYVDQVFIITHDEMLKEVANAKIYMFSRDKAANSETAVEQIY